MQLCLLIFGVGNHSNIWHIDCCVSDINFVIFVASTAIVFIAVVTFVDTFAFLAHRAEVLRHLTIHICSSDCRYFAPNQNKKSSLNSLCSSLAYTYHIHAIWSVVSLHDHHLCRNSSSSVSAIITSVQMGSIIIFSTSSNPFICSKTRKHSVTFRSPISPNLIVSYNKCVELSIGGIFHPPRRWILEMLQCTTLLANQSYPCRICSSLVYKECIQSSWTFSPH